MRRRGFSSAYLASRVIRPAINPFSPLPCVTPLRNPRPTKVKSRRKLPWKLLETSIALTTVYVANARWDWRYPASSSLKPP